MKNGYVYHIWKDAQKVRIADNCDNNAMKNWLRSLFRRKDLTGSNQGLNALTDVTIGSNNTKKISIPREIQTEQFEIPHLSIFFASKTSICRGFSSQGRLIWLPKGNQTSGN